MFLYNFIKKRTPQKLMEKYDRYFGFIERVMLSCNTLEQLENAWDWAREYCSQNRTFEHISADFDGYFVVADYFDGKRGIINEHYFRKRQELLDLKYGRTLQEKSRSECREGSVTTFDYI